MLGGTYEYLLSSLPNLLFQNTEEVRARTVNLFQKYAGGNSEPLSLTEILDLEAQKYLPKSAFEVFQKLNLNTIHEASFQNSKNTLLSAFAKFNFELKSELKKWRISQGENDGKAEHGKIEMIIGEGTPLEKEIQIMKYQWNALEDISAGHFADIEAVFSYKIKLMILQRWWSFDTRKGMRQFIQMTQNQADG